MKTSKTYPNTSQSFGMAGILILGMLVLSPVYLVLQKFIGKEAAVLLYYLVAVGIPLLIVQGKRKAETGSKSFSFVLNHPRIIPMVVVGTVALLLGVAVPFSSLMPMPESLKKAFEEMSSQTGPFSFLLLVVAAPILEEMIFRGIMLDGLLQRYSPFRSILLSSFLFGVVHLNPWQFVTGLILGAFSGWIYFKTRSLTLSIIVHASANLTAFCLRFLKDDGNVFDDSLSNLYGGYFNLMLVITAAVMVATVCIYLIVEELKKGALQKEGKMVENQMLQDHSSVL
ncbi:MAG: CPBP family intramembrane metalloprotease [Marinilabiliales bacterium]|nr:CPBP family intramembrane metalloprotease [Marinilabiliales bacterium]